MKRFRWIAFCLLAMAGCGNPRPKLVPVEGTVTLDGEVVEGAIVAFEMINPPAEYGRPSSAITDAAGKFQVQTYEPGDGLPPGKYRVLVQKREPIQPLGENYDSEMGTVNGRGIQYRMIVPAKYSDPTASGLEVEVTSKGLHPAVIALSSEGTGPQIQTIGPSADDP